MVQQGKGNDHSSTELVSYFETRRLLGDQVSSSLNSVHRILGSSWRGKEIVAMQVSTESLPLRTYLC